MGRAVTPSTLKLLSTSVSIRERRAFAAARLSASMEKVMYLHFSSPLLPFFKLIFKHIRVLPADRVKSVVLRRNFDSRLCLFLSCTLIDERELHRNGSVKVVEKIAPVFKNGCLIVCLCKLIVNIFKDKAFYCIFFRYPANPVRVHLQVGNGLLCGAGLPVALCRLYHGGDFFLFLRGSAYASRDFLPRGSWFFVLPLTIADTSFSSFRCFSMTA